MKEAIQKAREGGWEGIDVGNDGNLYHHICCTNTAFLDPLFWQALGKAMGWFEMAGKYHDLTEGFNPKCTQCQWHRFIDHLAEGKDVESFFSELLK